MRKLVIAGFASAMLMVGIGACGNVDKHIDCDKICNEYKDCYDSNYNVSDCKDRCNNYGADNNEERKAHADACESCIDDRSCTEEAFACGDACSSIVP